MKEENPYQNDFGQLDLIKDDQENQFDQKNKNDLIYEGLGSDVSGMKRVKSEEGLFPKTVLILDTETTGLDRKKDFCIEVGAILFHVNTRSVLAQQSFLLPADSNNAEKINHIPAEITKLPQPFEEGLKYFVSLVDSADVIVAHNAAFDRQWFGKDFLPKLNKPWICSMEDIPWPLETQLSKRPSVRDLALAYGIPVWNAHRALTDCIYLAEVFKRCPDLELLLSYGLEPRRLMRANVSYEERHLAKEAGFRWNDPVSGAWTRRLSEREVMTLNFQVSEVDVTTQ